MHAQSSEKTQTALGFWKDVGLLKNRNGWEFVGDGVSSQFIVTCCCNGPLCVAELVLWLFHTLIWEQYLVKTYVFIYIYISICVYFNRTLSTSFNTTLINSNWWNGMDFTYPYTAVYSQITIIYLPHSDHKNLVRFILLIYTYVCVCVYIYIHINIYILSMLS